MLYPKTIYQTNEYWGEEFYLSQEDMEENIAELKKLGSDWQDISLEDCEEFDLEKDLKWVAVYLSGKGDYVAFEADSLGEHKIFNFVDASAEIEDVVRDLCESRLARMGLGHHSETILHYSEWSDDIEHLSWVATAPQEEIEDWLHPMLQEQGI